MGFAHWPCVIYTMRNRMANESIFTIPPTVVIYGVWNSSASHNFVVNACCITSHKIFDGKRFYLGMPRQPHHNL